MSELDWQIRRQLAVNRVVVRLNSIAETIEKAHPEAALTFRAADFVLAVYNWAVEEEQRIKKENDEESNCTCGKSR
jgi:predicted metal-dependent peptidase